MEENHYYPFGLKHGNYNAIRKDVKYKEELAEKKEVKQVVPEQVKLKYLYNGKELQDELELNVYDYGARVYDPAAPRFWQVDPDAEKYQNQSVYVYADNNPVFFVDINGMGTEEQDWKPVKGQPGKWKAEKGDSAATLAKDANISFERAKEVLANTPKDNTLGNMGTYVDENDGIVKSAVDEGDVVAVPEQVEAFEAKKTKQAEIKKQIKNEISKNEEKIKDISKSLDVLQIDFDNSTDALHGKHDGLHERNVGYILFHVNHQNKVKQKMNILRGKKDSLEKVNIKLKKVLVKNRNFYITIFNVLGIFLLLYSFTYILAYSLYYYDELSINSRYGFVLKLISVYPSVFFVIFSVIYLTIRIKKIIFIKKKKNKLYNILFSVILIYFASFILDPFYHDFNMVQTPSFKLKLFLDNIFLFEVLDIILMPFFEELFFRELLLYQFTNKYFGVLITSILYSINHFYAVDENFSLNYLAFLNYFIIGVVFALLRVKFGLFYAISTHVFYNALVYLFNNKIINLYLLDYVKSNYLYWTIYIFIVLFVLFSGYRLLNRLNENGSKDNLDVK